MLRNQWWNVYYQADPQAEGARYGAQVLAQGMLHAKISVQEMAAVGGISGDALRGYFAQHGIEAVNYDCAIMLAPVSCPTVPAHLPSARPAQIVANPFAKRHESPAAAC